MASPAPRAVGAASEFAAGFGTLLRGFAMWRRRPGLMALGLVPALIVGAVLLTLLIVVLINIDGIATLVTPFADPWDEGSRRLLRLVVALAILVGVIVLLAFGFTALTLLVGDPFYEKIWREVENELGDFAGKTEPGFWRAAADSLRLVGRAIVTALLMALVGLVPVVGAPAAAVIGLFLSGRLVALELTARPLEARGLVASERWKVLRTRSPRVIGFGVAVHLCFLIPGGAIVVMPAAVAGATALARHVLEARAALQPPPADPSPTR